MTTTNAILLAAGAFLAGFGGRGLLNLEKRPSLAAISFACGCVAMAMVLSR